MPKYTAADVIAVALEPWVDSSDPVHLAKKCADIVLQELEAEGYEVVGRVSPE